MQPLVNKLFLEKAEAFKPQLIQKERRPLRMVTIEKDSEGFGRVVGERTITELADLHLGKGDTVCLDYGDHYVGYLTLRLSSVGSIPDAPLFMKLKFGETATEITDHSEDYNGKISSSWIQEEWMHVDVLPAVITLPRRYAMRFLEISVLDTSPKFRAVIEGADFQAVSAVDGEQGGSYKTTDPLLQKIDAVSVKTLEDCMQDVFEDGPKRDRRLWIGDLRLEALANYATFRNFDLVKRCLYLFAGSRMEDGAVGACLFTQPTLCVDDIYMYDYALFFVSILLDYYKESGDEETARELWQTAKDQLEIGAGARDARGVVKEDCKAFLDWKIGLNKQAGAHAVWIYSLRCGIELGELLGEDVERYKEWLRKALQAAKEYLWDPERKVFVSGAERQVSYASQVWMVLAGVWDDETNRQLLERTVQLDPEYNMVTPYMNHNFVMAYLSCGEYDKALEYIRSYWGEMIHDGADTFWELYNPRNKRESPYGSSIINSYCHAWSCTPTYILRKYFLRGEKNE